MSPTAVAEPEVRTESFMPTATPSPTAAPPETRADRLYRLENQALVRGIDPTLLDQWRSIGNCDDQVTERLGNVERWLAS